MNNSNASSPPRWLGGVGLPLSLALAVGLLTRVALAFAARADLSPGPSLVAAFAWGTLFDFATALFWIAPLAILLAALPRETFSRVWPRRGAVAAFSALILALLFGALAEWLFWDEFGARANFIAVDYLVYTTEVIGNIRESYPLSVLLPALALLAGLLCLALARLGLLAGWLDAPRPAAADRWRVTGFWILLAFVAALALDQRRLPPLGNTYHHELAKNGLWSFVAAFRSNQLDYATFYPSLPLDQAFARMHADLGLSVAVLTAPAAGTVPHTLARLEPAPRPNEPALRLNVIQITVESLSADFLARYGNTEGVTPNLDALASQALVFDNFYATGTRTDRGMEALTLSVPPTPGRSLVKRPGNEGLFTLGSVFREQGYDTAFLYGGHGYFDNMNHFFGSNGYRVVDRAAVARDDVTFANAWGACDEDLYRWTLREADRAHAAAKPFFHFVMTTSNHRPYTYPEGRIDLPPKTSKRPGAVKYTDYAIGEFLRAAATKPWYRDTVFVIVADHCASSAGKTELPAEKYHIPLLIFAPGGPIAPGAVATLTSQVDYAPTLLGLLNWSYPSQFFGHDVLAPAYRERPGRAFIGNYQKLGLLTPDRLAILGPVRRSATYALTPGAQTPVAPDPELTAQTIAAYQSASWLFAHHPPRALPAPSFHETPQTTP